tara:strand:- start:1642 stop:1980 length:339 start_codon:yes stop_codon:yes gene_type:complete
MGTMGYLNLSSSIRYGPHGKRRKTRAFSKKSKRQKYQEMILQQQKIFDRVIKEVSETEKIPSLLLQGGGGGQKNLEWEQEKLKISSQYTIAPAYNKGAYQVIGKNNIKDIGK